MSVSLGGFFSGLDSSSLIQQLTQLSLQPAANLENSKAKLTEQSGAFNFVQTSLASLKTKLTTLNDSALYSGKAAKSSDGDIAAVSVDYTAPTSSTVINITQVASNSIIKGGAIAGAYIDTKLSSVPAVGADISKVLGTTDYTGKTFTINNSTVTLSAGETISSLLTKMNAVSGIAAAYDATTGKFSLTSASTILLGSGADTSNFLQQAQLFNNGTGTVTSSTGVGRLTSTTAFSSGDLRSGTALSSGTFSVNGVSVSYSTSDSLSTVLSNITNSSAGVIATYDSYTDRVILTNKNRGSQNITVSDGTSNIATALRIKSTDSSITLGNSTKFTVGDDATVRQSEDQTLTASELGITGLTVTAIATGTVTIDVAPDTATIKKAIDDFVNQYNSAQNLIKSYVKINTSDLTQNGLLANDSTVTFLPTTLRNSTTTQIRSTGTIRMLEDLGIVGNASDNTLTLSDSSKLLAALQDHSDEVIDLFTNASTGLAYRLGGIVDSYADAGTGALAVRQNSITEEKKRMDDEIVRIKIRVAAEEVYLKNQFAALDSASAKSQQTSSFFS